MSEPELNDIWASEVVRLRDELERSKRQAEEAIVVFAQLAHLQALVRAAVERWRAQINVQEGVSFRMAMKELEATLDATTPAPMDAAETHDRMFNHMDRHPEAL